MEKYYKVKISIETDDIKDNHKNISVSAEAEDVYDALWTGMDEILSLLKGNGSILLKELINSIRINEAEERTNAKITAVKNTLTELQEQRIDWNLPSFQQYIMHRIPLHECKEYIDIVKKLMPKNSLLFFKLKCAFDDKTSPKTEDGISYSCFCRLIGSIALQRNKAE